MPGIFISYRRSDAIAWAGRLHDSLEKHFPGVSIFMDIEAIPPGVKFASYIREAVGSCEVLLVLIGPNWLSAVDSEGDRRLENPEDFVALEIVAALDRDVRIIPTLVGETSMPSRQTLPDRLRPLCDFNNFVIADRSWKDDCARLAKHIEGVVTRPLPASAPRKWRFKAIAGAVFVLASVAVFLWWQRPVPPPPMPQASTPAAPPSNVPVVPHTETPGGPTAAPSSILDLGLDGRWELIEAVEKGKKISQQLVVELTRAGDVLKIELPRTPAGQSQGSLALTVKPNQITLDFLDPKGNGKGAFVLDRAPLEKRRRFSVTLTERQKSLEVGWVDISEDWRRLNGELNDKGLRFHISMTIGPDGKSFEGTYDQIGQDDSVVLAKFRKVVSP